MFSVRLLNVSLSAGIMILVIAMLRLILKRVPRKYFCMLWALAALRLVLGLLPVSLKSPLSLIPSAEVIPQEVLAYEGPMLQFLVSADVLKNHALGLEKSVSLGISADMLQTRALLFTTLWIVGVGIMLAYAVVSWLRTARTVSASAPIGGNVRVVDDVGAPFIWGIFRPCIYVPSGMDDRSLALVLKHEMRHLHNLDHCWKPLGYLLLCVYWFNPLIWLAYILFCRDLEFACDEAVVGPMDQSERIAYTRALLCCSAGRRSVITYSLTFGTTAVKERVKAVLNYKKPNRWMTVIGVILCLVIALCFLADPGERRLQNEGARIENVYINEKITAVGLSRNRKTKEYSLVLDVKNTTEGTLFYEGSVVEVNELQMVSPAAGEIKAGKHAKVYLPISGEDAAAGIDSLKTLTFEIRFGDDPSNLKGTIRYQFDGE